MSIPNRPPPPPPSSGSPAAPLHTAGSLRLPAHLLSPPPSAGDGLGVDSSVVGHLSGARQPAGVSHPLGGEKDDYYANLVLTDMLVTPGAPDQECVGHEKAKKFLTESTILPLLLPEFFPLQTATTNVLLFGPPGTGKTMLVKSLIHDLRGDASNNFNVNFFSVSGSAVGNKYRGESEKVLRAVFDVARTHRASPTSSEGGEEGPAISIVLLDEVDSLFGDATNASSDESSLRLKTTLLTHLDGVAGAGGEGENKVVVVGTTNLPFSLAEALLRRFNKRILIDLPTPADRASIISGCLSGVAVSPAVSPAAIAERTEGWSGSDLTTLCRDIAMNPMRRYFERYDSVREIDEYNKRLVRDGLGGIAVEDIGEVTDADVQLALERVKPASKAGVEECIRFAESFGSG